MAKRDRPRPDLGRRRKRRKSPERTVRCRRGASRLEVATWPPLLQGADTRENERNTYMPFCAHRLQPRCPLHAPDAQDQAPSRRRNRPSLRATCAAGLTVGSDEAPLMTPSGRTVMCRAHLVRQLLSHSVAPPRDASAPISLCRCGLGATHMGEDCKSLYAHRLHKFSDAGQIGTPDQSV